MFKFVLILLITLFLFHFIHEELRHELNVRSKEEENSRKIIQKDTSKYKQVSQCSSTLNMKIILSSNFETFKGRQCNHITISLCFYHDEKNESHAAYMCIISKKKFQPSKLFY